MLIAHRAPHRNNIKINFYIHKYFFFLLDLQKILRDERKEKNKIKNSFSIFKIPLNISAGPSRFIVSIFFFFFVACFVSSSYFETSALVGRSSEASDPMRAMRCVLGCADAHVLSEESGCVVLMPPLSRYIFSTFFLFFFS